MSQSNGEEDPRPVRQEAIITLPLDWWVIPLSDDRARTRSIDALLKREAPKGDINAQLRADIRKQLQDVTAGAKQAGGRFYAMSLVRLEQLPLVISVVVFRETRTMGAVKVRLQVVDPEATTAEGPLGLVYRSVKVEAGPDELGARDTKQVVAEYWLDPKDGLGVYHAVFTTPHLALQEQMLILFDAMIESISILSD